MCCWEGAAGEGVVRFIVGGYGGGSMKCRF